MGTRVAAALAVIAVLGALAAVLAESRSDAVGAVGPGTGGGGGGKDGLSPQIVGGDDAKPGQFPELVSIQVGYGDEHEHFCGGVLIDPHWILTAGHCLDQVDPEAISILAGAADLSSPGALASRTRIAAYEIHESYNPEGGPSLAHDVALIYLDEPMPLNAYIQVASLQNVPPGDGDPVTVAGWGQTENGSPAISTVLQWTKLAVVASDKCESILQGYARILDDQICAASAEAGLHAECKGDSGGALLANGLVVGIVSWSRKPCGDYPGVFASVPKHYDWIREKTGLDNL